MYCQAVGTLKMWAEELDPRFCPLPDCHFPDVGPSTDHVTALSFSFPPLKRVLKTLTS